MLDVDRLGGNFHNSFIVTITHTHTQNLIRLLEARLRTIMV